MANLNRILLWKGASEVVGGEAESVLGYQTGEQFWQEHSECAAAYL
jgi:hypothetical protein